MVGILNFCNVKRDKCAVILQTCKKILTYKMLFKIGAYIFQYRGLLYLGINIENSEKSEFPNFNFIFLPSYQNCESLYQSYFETD